MNFVSPDLCHPDGTDVKGSTVRPGQRAGNFVILSMLGRSTGTASTWQHLHPNVMGELIRPGFIVASESKKAGFIAFRLPHQQVILSFAVKASPLPWMSTTVPDISTQQTIGGQIAGQCHTGGDTRRKLDFRTLKSLASCQLAPMNSASEIHGLAMKLPKRSRLKLAGELLRSVASSTTTPEDVLHEAIRRDSEMESGTVTALSESEFWNGIAVRRNPS